MKKEQLKQIKDGADILRRGDLVDPYPDTLTPSERTTASEAFALYSVRAEIPRAYLWGRQLPEEYTRSPEYRMKSLFFQMGQEVLNQKPVWAVLNPTSRGQDLVIVDGHKRTRYSALFGIEKLPTEVIDLEHLATAWGMAPGELGSELGKQSDLALWRFAAITRAKGKQFSAPHSLPGELTAADLPSYFQELRKRRPEVQMQPNQLYVLHGRR